MKKWLISLLLMPMLANAAPLTEAQMQTLAAALRASSDPVVVNALAIRNDTALTLWCNTDAASNTLAWREAMPPHESDAAPDYSAFDSLAAGKRDSWGLFLAYPRDYTRLKTRKWVTDVWGPSTAGSNAEAILQAATEKASNDEMIYGGTSATTGTVSAIRRVWSGDVTLDELSNSLNRY